MPGVLRKITRAARHTEFTWRYGFNFAPSMAYRLERHHTAEEVRRVVRCMNRDGLAVTTVDALLGPNSGFDELSAAIEARERELAAEFAERRRHAHEGAAGTKTFFYELLGDKPILDTSSIYFRFAVQQPMLDVANGYFGMYTRLRQYNVWHTFPSASAPRESQLWHRDREDLLILKVFVYMNDVDETAGPFTYAPGTHLKGAVQRTPEAFNENGVWRSRDEQMAKIVPPEKWIPGIGQRGTIVFADTHGYHKGGHAKLRDRLLYLAMFTSPASESKELMRRPAEPFRFSDRARTVALAAPHSGPWLTLS